MKVVRLWSLFLLMIIVNFDVAAQCSITMDAGTSGCYYSGGQSLSTITVEVSWSNAPSGQNIIVTGPPGSVPATRTITPGTITVQYNDGISTFVNSTQVIVSPQLVAFEIPANGATGLNVTAAFSGTPSCNATSNNFNAPVSCQPLECATGNLGGTVFFDFNADGVMQTDEIETGINNVTVTAIDIDGTTYTTTSQRYGRWVIAGIPAGKYPVRVEFSDLPGYARQGTPRGNDGNTTVQFISSADCTVDLGVLNNVDYCDDAPPIFVPCYVNGDPLAGGGSGSADAFVRFDYDASGAKDPTKMDVLASAAEVGSLWGVAHNKYTNKIFTSATIKRHVGLGPEGLGGIYVLDPNAPGVITNWDVNTDFGINVGTIATNASRGLTASLSTGSVDNQGFTSIGKVGIGDIDISESGNQLYMVNLFDKKVYRINLAAYNTNPLATPSTDANWTIPDPGCTNGQFRPFALKWHKGLVYVGAVCDASSGTKSELRAYVYRLNPTTGVWTTIFDFPLTYPKGFPTADDRTATGWFPWTDDFNDFIITNTSSNRDDVVYPQPMFTDLEIDVDGTLVLGFGDRGAMQTGYRNLHPGGDNGRQYTGYVGGDILRAFNNGTGRFVLENASKAGPNMGYDMDNNQGPGFGEYYNDDWFNGDASPKLRHSECVIGGLALRPGSGQVIATHVDPVDGINWSGGVRHYNNTTGLTDYGFVIYRTTGGTVNDTGTQGKAAGLGDIEVGCALPTFIEIGNRVWVDADQDGTQDPDEIPLAGVEVQLYKQDGTLLATTLTNAMGEYYFSSSTPQMADPNLNWVGTGMDAMIQPSSAYYLVFGASQYSGGQLVLGGNNYNLTTANNESTSPANNSNDSDATLVSGLPRITINYSPIEGAVNHTYDVGFWLAPVCTTPIATVNPTNPSCVGANAPNNGTLTIAGFTTGQRYQYSAGATFNSGIALPASITAIPSGGIIVNNLANTTQQYTVRIYDATDNTCFIDRTVSITAVVPPTAQCTPMPNTNCATPNGSATVTTNANQILWSTWATTATISGLNNGTYTVTVTDTNTGCTNTCQAVVASTTTLPTAQCDPMPNTNCATPNGSATVTTNANQILWSTGATTATITGLSNGTYTVTVTNTTTGCTHTCQAVVGSNTVNPTCNIGVNSQPSCANLTGGSFTVTPSPSGTYSYAWSDNGAATANRTGLTGGTYTVTVTGSTTGCTGVCSVTLDTPTNCCSINPITLVSNECDDNGTLQKITDNRMLVGILVTNTNNTLTTYTVTVNGGTTISPNIGTYGAPQIFTFGPGTAGGGATFRITVTDQVTGLSCQGFIDVIGNVQCEGGLPPYCPTPQCGTATIQVNGN